MPCACGVTADGALHEALESGMSADGWNGRGNM